MNIIFINILKQKLNWLLLLLFFQAIHLQSIYEPLLARLGAANWTLTPIDFSPSATVPTNVVATETVPTATNLSPQNYVVTAIGADQITESLASDVASASNNLTLAGNFNTITWSAVTNAARYYVYKLRGGVYGYIGQSTGLTIRDDNITPDTLTTPPEAFITLSTGGLYPDDTPCAVTYHQNRRWFANTQTKPQTIFATRNGTEADLTSSIPSRADDALEFRVASQQQHAIQQIGRAHV